MQRLGQGGCELWFRHMNKLAVCHITADLYLKSGGPSRSVVQLTDALGDDCDVTLLTQSIHGEKMVESSNPSVDRRVLMSANALVQKVGLPLRQELLRMANANRPDLIHNHGVWLPVNHWAAAVARCKGIPLVTHSRGMLETWAIHHKAWKKRMAMMLYQRRDLREARVLIATAEAEYLSLRRLGLRQPIAVIPNGVQLPSAELLPQRPAAKTRTVLFVGRICPVKGLLNLIEAWACLRLEGWRLKIVGPDEAGHLLEVLAFLRRFGIENSVDCLGPIEDEDKFDLYQQADVLVLPSFSENFGLVVAEALAHGVPVITTKGTPWADLVRFGCGWWIDIGIEPLVRALKQAQGLTDAERRQMGERGRAYVQRYKWTDIAKQTAAVYKWILGQELLPGCVQLD